MRPPLVGLVGPRASAALGRLESALVRRGARAVWLDLGGFPRELSLGITREGVRSVAAGLDAELDAFFVERGEYMSPVTDWSPTALEWASLGSVLEEAVRTRQESRSVRASVFRFWSEHIPVVNPARAVRACLLAPALLRRLEAAGLPVAPFVSGNDLERIAYFVNAHTGECRARRMGQPSSREWRVDLDYLRDRHQDFDDFPLIVRQSAVARTLNLLTVGGRSVGAAVWNPAGERWSVCARPPREAETLAVRATEMAGLHVALVHVEQGDSAMLVGLDPEPDLARFEDQTGIDAISPVADLLLEPSGGAGKLPAPSTERWPEERSKPPSCHRARSPELRIGITGEASNEEVAALARALEARGDVPVLLELPWFPLHRAVHECATGGRIALDELGDLAAVFLRSTGAQSPLDAVLREQALPWPERRRSFCELGQHQAECFLFQYSLLEALGRRIPVINPPISQEIHRTKVYQLFSLMRAGYPVPATLAGNDREACARFVAEQGGESEVVVKPLAGVHKTSLLSERGLEACLAGGPVMLQRLIRGDTIRAYIVGGRLVGAGKILHSGAAVDSSLGQHGVEPVKLPASVVRLGWEAASHLGLAWTGMDFMREAVTGDYFILECNAAAMFAGFSRMTGFDVAKALADYLAELASRSPA